MRKLVTIQKKEKLNDVFATDDFGPGGANHQYTVYKKDEKYLNYDENLEEVATIKFQKGPRKDESSQHGILDSDLLEIARDRLQSFQSGPFNSEYNEKALQHIEKALYYMNKRVEDRISRGVLGDNKK